MNTYAYSGPVLIFGKPVINSWYGETTASSKNKALSNLQYQFKREYDLSPNNKVELTGRIEIIN